MNIDQGGVQKSKMSTLDPADQSQQRSPVNNGNTQFNTVSIHGNQSNNYAKMLFKYRDNSEARKLISSCGEYQQEKQYPGKTPEVKVNEQDGEIKVLSMVKPKYEKFKDAVDFRRHQQDYPGLDS